MSPTSYHHYVNSTAKDSDGVKPSLISLIGRFFDHHTRNTYQPKEYNGYISSVLRNYQQEKEYTKEITSTTRDVHHAGIQSRMMTIYFNAITEEA
jgi:hypothetical protein